MGCNKALHLALSGYGQEVNEAWKGETGCFQSISPPTLSIRTLEHSSIPLVLCWLEKLQARTMDSDTVKSLLGLSSLSNSQLNAFNLTWVFARLESYELKSNGHIEVYGRVCPRFVKYDGTFERLSRPYGPLTLNFCSVQDDPREVHESRGGESDDRLRIQ